MNKLWTSCAALVGALGMACTADPSPGAGAPGDEFPAVPTGATSPYGAFEIVDGEPVFVYRGPQRTDVRGASSPESVPKHVFGNDAWSAVAEVDGRVRLYLRTGGPLLLGGPGGLVRHAAEFTTDVAALVAPMTIGPGIDPYPPPPPIWRFRGRLVELAVEDQLAARWNFAAGVTFALDHTLTLGKNVEVDSIRPIEVWDLTPVPLLPEALASSAALTDIAANRLAYNDDYRFTIAAPSTDHIVVRVQPPGDEADSPPANFGPYPRAMHLRNAAGAPWSALIAEEACTVVDKLREPWPPVVHSHHWCGPITAPVVVGAAPIELTAGWVIQLTRDAASEAPTRTRTRLWLETGFTPPAPLTRAAVPHVPDTQVDFRGPEVPAWLTTEWAWHGRMLQAFAAYDSAFDEVFVDQGSAYLFVQGLSGAVRDFALNAIGLLAVRPDLARSTLRTAMQWTTADGHTYYGGGGWGGLSDVGIRNESTDLDLFLLWSLTRYLTLTRDLAFLDEVVPFADDEGHSTVRERIDLAVDHLMHATGTGPNGWLRVGSGDWSDGILLFSRDAEVTKARGESMFNTAMALYVLPRVAPWLRTWDRDAADQLQRFTANLRAAAASAWRDQWWVRGSFGTGRFLGEDRPFLESNLWALWAELGTIEQQDILSDAITRILDAPEPLGARIVDPPSEVAGTFLVEGWDVNGGTWPAMQGLLAPAYAVRSPERAWQSLQEASFQRHSEVYPDIWYGIWTGPDSYNASNARRPGETFIHIATPMIEFPAANMNAHSGPLLALDHLVGLDGGPEGLRLDPRLPLEQWRYQSALVAVDWTLQKIALDYLGASVVGDVWRVRVPTAWPQACDGAGHAVASDDGWVERPLGAVELKPCPQ